MKKIVAGVLTAGMFWACSKKEEPKGNLLLTGNIKGLKQGTLYIQKLKDTSLVVVDSIAISGDSGFSSDLTIDSPQMFYLFLDRGVSKTIDNSLMVFVEPGKINVDTSLERFYAEAKVTGSENHELYEEFKKVNSKFVNQQLDLTAAKLQAFKDKRTFSEADNAKSDAILKRQYRYAINFAVTHHDKEVAPFIALSQIPDAGIAYLDTIHKSLTPKIAASRYGKLLAHHIAERKKQEQQ